MGEEQEPGVASRRRRRLPGTLWQCLAVAVVASIGVTLVLQLWRADLSVPFSFGPDERSTEVYPADGPFYLMLVQGLLQHDTYLTNPSLGAPHGQQLYDVPSGNDHLQLGILWGLGQATGNAVEAVNLYYLLTYPAVAVVAFLVARRLRLGAPVAAAVAILYTFLPYHQARGTSHLLLSGYYLVPLAVLLVLRVVGDDPPFTGPSPSGGWRLRLRSRASLAWLLVCAGLASTGAYYAVFTVVLLGGVVAADLLARRGVRSVVSGAVAVAVIGVVFVAHLVPSFVYWADHGGSTNLIARFAAETEVDGLKLSQLLLPIKAHRIPALAAIQRESQKASRVRSERGQQLGIVGAVGLVGLVAGSMARLIGRRRPGGLLDPDDPDGALLGRMGVLALLAILVGTISGISLLLAGVGLRQFRSWNRLSIFIGLVALVAAGLGAQRAGRWLRARGVPRAVLGLVLAGVTVLGVLDQTSARNVPRYAEQKAQWASDDVFMDEIADTLGPGAMVYQLPYVFFPEAGQIGHQGPYDGVRGYLHAPELRWSFGDTRLRHPEWQLYYRDRPLAEQLDAYAAIGFEGLWVNLAGYVETPSRLRTAAGPGPEITGQISAELAQEPSTSPDGSLQFWDLRPRRAALVTAQGEAAVDALGARALAQAAPESPDLVYEEF